MGVLLDNVRQGLNLLFTPMLYYGVVASIALQLATWERGDRTQDKIQDQYANQQDHFDFIIVGGGTSGSVLANRLSQYYNILLLEAGGEPSPLQFVPGLTRNIVNHPQVDWMHKTVAQKKSAGFSQYKRVNWPSGRTLGGSGSLDFLMYLRGHPQDFDNWAKITKDASWSYDNLLRHFQRAEDLLANSTDPGAHRHGGELRIQKSDFLPLAKEFLAAAKELGYQNLDLNGHFTQGFDEVYSTIKKGERQAPIRAFLDPVRKRKSLVIRKFALVSKIKMRNDNTAYGVEYERHGEKYIAYANREVILAGGTLGSSKLLMLSGIGPKKHLEELGIKAVVNLPVGQNLQDHVGTYLGPFFINKPLSYLKERDVSAESYVEYGAQGTGPLTFGGFSATGLISSLYAIGRGESLWPDLQLTLFPTSVDKSFATDLSTTHGLQAETLTKYYQHAVGKHSFHILTNIARPAGRGELKLASRTATDPLVISPGYYEDPWGLDIKALVDGVKKSLRLIEGSTTFQDIGGRFTSEILPGCAEYPFRSDEYFACYLRQFTISMYNPVGTCAMGPLDSPFSVVDPSLRVLGTRNLRVIDASIMPSIVAGGTLAPTIMIAEKGAEMIINFWNHQNPKDFTPKENSIDTVSSSSKVAPQKLPKATPKPPMMTPKPLKFSTQMSKTETTTTKSVNLMAVSPFSVSIKTSAATSTAAPTTTKPQTPKSVSFPILSPKKPKRLRQKFKQQKVTYFQTSTPKTTTTPQPSVSQTTRLPFDFSTSTFSIQPAREMKWPHNDIFMLKPTTFRPHLMLIDPEDPTNSPIEPTEIIKPEVKQIITNNAPGQQQSFGQSILYLVQKQNEPEQNFRAQLTRPHQNINQFVRVPQEQFQAPRPQPAQQQQQHFQTSPPQQFRQNVPQRQNAPQKYRKIPATSHYLPGQFIRPQQTQQGHTQHVQQPHSHPQQGHAQHAHQGHNNPQLVRTNVPSSPNNIQLLPFEFAPDTGEFEDYTANDRFARHQGNGRLRYLEKPIKVHTFRHPTRVLRRYPKHQNFPQNQNNLQQKIPQRPPPPQTKQKATPKIAADITPAQVVFHSESDPLVAQGSQFVQNAKTFKLNPLNPLELEHLAEHGFPVSYSYFN